MASMRGRTVRNLSATTCLNSSRDFYEKFFRVPPVKLKSDQLKFLPSLPPLNLTISRARHGERGGGFRQPYWDRNRLKRGRRRAFAPRVMNAELQPPAQLNMNCCYANQSKF